VTTPDRSLAAALERFAAIVQSLMDSAAPVGGDGKCAVCDMQVDDPVGPADLDARIAGHDPSECGWWIARNQCCQADVNEVRRLAHVLRYDAGQQRRGWEAGRWLSAVGGCAPTARRVRTPPSSMRSKR
jgi:hypothetical protein